MSRKEFVTPHVTVTVVASKYELFTGDASPSEDRLLNPAQDYGFSLPTFICQNETIK